MALFGFGKKKTAEAAATAEPEALYQRDLRKAGRFYEHADVAIESRQYEFAIELLTSGLRFDPDNMSVHEKLLDVAKHWKVSGDKAKKTKRHSDSGIDRALHAEQVWALDFTDPKLAYRAMELMVEADAEPANAELALGDVALWLGQMAMDYNQAQGSDKKLFLAIRDRFKDIGVYDRALEAHSRAIRVDPSDQKLLEELKELEALKYTQDRRDAEGGAMGNVRDAEAQELLRTESSAAHGSAADRLIAARREAYEAEPESTDNLYKLVDALLKTEDTEREDEAIGILQQAHQRSNEYRHKARAGDIRIRRYARDLRGLKNKLKANPDSAAARKAFEALNRERLLFELEEYADRVKHYPTDMRLRFEYGRRLLAKGDIDESIAMLQQATQDAKSRSAASLLLGKAFNAKEWHDEAIEILNRAFDEHDIKDDAVGKELRYERMVSLMRKGESGRDAESLREAQADASALLRLDITFRDIKDRMEKIKALLAEIG